MHGTLQVNLKRFNMFANVEAGNDLVNKTVFATNTVNTTSIGVNAPLGKGWNFHAEGIRNKLISELNPERAFLLGSEGLPVNLLLSGMDSWHLFFRVEKHLNWGAPLPPEYTHTNGPTASLVGDIEGFVKERGIAANGPAASVRVMLDGVRPADTDETGKFRITDVAEGLHRVSLSTRELLADYLPGSTTEVVVRVQPKKIARADLEVAPTVSFEGDVAVSGEIKAEETILRLTPGSRYTTPDPDGHFAFYNLPEGDYHLELDLHLHPAGTRSEGDPARDLHLQKGGSLGDIKFKVSFSEEQKPVRRLILSSNPSTSVVAPPPTPPPARAPARKAVPQGKTATSPEVPAGDGSSTPKAPVAPKPAKKRPVAKTAKPVALSVPSPMEGMLPVHVELAAPLGAPVARVADRGTASTAATGSSCRGSERGVSATDPCEHPSSANQPKRNNGKRRTTVSPTRQGQQSRRNGTAATKTHECVAGRETCRASATKPGADARNSECCGYAVADGGHVTVELPHTKTGSKRKRPVDVSSRRSDSNRTGA